MEMRRFMPSPIEIKNLWVDYEGVEAIQDISVTIQPGEFLTVLGPSGCGKSTLIRTIAGFVEASQGDILMNGRRVSGPGPDRVMVFQEFDQLFPWLTVRDNVALPLKVGNLTLDVPYCRGSMHIGLAYNKQARYNRVARFLKMVGLLDFANAYPHQLSGGMKQRAAIARALAMEPAILLMDEPFGALDAQTRAILQGELVKLHDQIGCTTIFITHNIQEAIILGDRVLMMTAWPGRVKEIVPVTIPKPRRPETPVFMELWDYLYDLLEVKRF